MLKASAKLNDGTMLIVLGLSDRNVAELRRHNPILFSLAEVGAGERQVCITWNDCGRAAFPDGFDGIGVVLNDAMLAGMRDRLAHAAAEGLKFCLFRAKDEQEMERILRGLIGPKTILTHKGFAPSAVPPPHN